MQHVSVDPTSLGARSFSSPGYPFSLPRFDGMPPGIHVASEPPPDPKEIPLSELTIQHLQSADDIARMATLRQQIDLSAATSVDPQFAEHEKKETDWEWSSPSSCMGRS